jgi:hypothetical protein
VILPEAKVQKRNIFLALICAVLGAAWILVTDRSFSNGSSFVIVGMIVGYLAFVVFDYRQLMHQIFRPGNPYAKRRR